MGGAVALTPGGWLLLGGSLISSARRFGTMVLSLLHRYEGSILCSDGCVVVCRAASSRFHVAVIPLNIYPLPAKTTAAGVVS